MLDIEFVLSQLKQTYWASTRPREVIERAIQHSLVFGVYEAETKKQVGFARVVTDYATFGWLCDVVIASELRGKGLGKLLISEVTKDERVKSVMCLLGTRDAHGLYEKFGFQRQENMKRPSDGHPIGSKRE